jgi:hypothetical protein
LSNSAYYPLQTGTDLAEAAETVRLLLGVNGAQEQVSVEVQIESDTHSAPRYFEVTSSVQLECHLPAEHARLVEPLLVATDRLRTGVQMDDWVDLWVLPTDVDALARLAELPPSPASVQLQGIAPVAFSWDLLAGPERAIAEWTDCWWRPVPEAGLIGDNKHAGIVVTVNSSGLWDLAPAADGFQLYVETREGRDDMAQWIASQVGRPLLGPPLLY